MDLRVIVAYLDCNRLSVRAIHNDIVATLAPNIVGYSTARRHLCDMKFLPSIEETSYPGDRKHIDDADEPILSALKCSTFASVRRLSRPTHLPPPTVYRCRTQSLGFTARHLGWVSCAPSDA
jgi:hypothetical protein